MEIYSLTVGYIRPVQQWNNGKQAEFKLPSSLRFDCACGSAAAN
jgi:ribonucleoside-triphosphate reductase